MIRLRLLFMVVLAVVLLQGCSKDSTPSAEMVPAKVDYVAFVNADTLAEAVRDLLPVTGKESVQKLSDCCDLSRLLVFKPVESRQPFAVVGIKDKEKLTALLTEMEWQRRNVDGDETYSPDTGGEFAPCIVVDGNMAWILGTRGDLKNRRESMLQAKKENFAKHNLDFNTTGTTRLTAYIAPDYVLPLDNPDALIKLTGEINADLTLTLKAGIISIAEGKTGETIPITALAPITDTRFARYLPGTNSLVAALGLTKGINWGGLVDLVGSGLGTQNQGMLQTLVPYMNSLNGTFAIGIGPFTAESLTSDELESQSLIVYATLEANKATEAVEEINGNLREKGLNPRPRTDGVYAFDLNGVKYRYTATPDGVFLFALNRELESNQGADSTLFAGRLAYANLELPPLRDIVASSASNLSVKTTLTVTPEGITITMRSGHTLPLVAISQYFSLLNEAVNATDEDAPDYYDEY